MREIEFRGKRKNNGEWVYGDFCTMLDRPFILVIWRANFHRIEVIPETVGQYTGLKDKNGVKIFEGDIVKWITSDDEVVFDSVKWLGSGLCLRNSFNTVAEYMSLQYKAEVIGNIHDNPELLKEKK